MTIKKSEDLSKEIEFQQSRNDPSTTKLFPSGIVLGPDGKPCRTCSSFASWAALTKKNITQNNKTTSLTGISNQEDCPPDVDVLGRSSWTLLHSIAAQYPDQPSLEEQANAVTFIKSFSKLYPCWTCASDFQMWLTKEANTPRVSSRDDFGRWLCEAHNAVNSKLGKPFFDCDRWQERWRYGWKDGRCD